MAMRMETLAEAQGIPWASSWQHFTFRSRFLQKPGSSSMQHCFELERICEQYEGGNPQTYLDTSSLKCHKEESAGHLKVCGALNVTVSPGPVVDYLEGDNATLLCHVSQKRRKDSLLAVRWFFSGNDSPEALMVKMTKLRAVQYYGNFSRSAHRRRLLLLEEQRGTLYRLSVLTLQLADQGQYVCRVQEISKHRNKWTAWSNGSSATEMRVTSLKASEDSPFEKKKETWAFFEDLYMYAVLVCCVGILSVLLFTLVIICQSVFHKRKSRVRHYLVKCPQNSSGETVTSITSLAPLQPKKGKRQKEKVDVPPAVPAKAPVVATSFHRPKLLKPQRKGALDNRAVCRKYGHQRVTVAGKVQKDDSTSEAKKGEKGLECSSLQGAGAILHSWLSLLPGPQGPCGPDPFTGLWPCACRPSQPPELLLGSKMGQPKIAEENLTYAELELTKPPRASQGAPPSTVYAQILFEENKL
ncbi:hypothetical protein H920_04620 [Fukomys damarensis]|uniref:V-set and transmembrane domain-containing protein 4 n=1 Tax=Fukomys damarensis TaxID=885580 RepID=A0A091DPA6_FUKDA|nr:hypothetical protein H920_04620 [Fukomys damarensis]